MSRYRWLIAVVLCMSTSAFAQEMIDVPAQKVPVLYEADVVVVGGGLSGVGAALGAARAGAKTLVIERTGYLGGWIRGNGLGNVIAVQSWRPSLREGVLLDICKGVVEYGLEDAPDLDTVLEHGELVCSSNPEVLPQVFQSLLLKSGAQILYFSMYSGSIVKDKKIDAGIIESHVGPYAVRGKVFVDCTGLATVAAESGAPTKKDIPEAELGLQFYITNVDTEKFKTWAKSHPKQDTPELRQWLEGKIGRPMKVKRDDPRDDGFSWSVWWERNAALLGDKIHEAVDKGDLTLFQRVGKKGIIGISEGLKMYESKVTGGMARPRTFITNVDPSDIVQVSEAHEKSTQMAMEYGRFLRKYVPGFENSQVTRIADMTLERAGRSIDNDAAPTRAQVNEAATNDDVVVVLQRGREGGVFEIPYRTMVAEKIQNLLAVGKSSSGGKALRTHMLSVIMGQAAGTAAAMAAKENVAVKDVPIRKLQAQLRADGIDLPQKPEKPQSP
jgi:ribulose 1,5-bisphosphate synthetase/thiazole synthase